ncbi:MAG: SprT-like domain-containing protein [Bacilli bacterium]|nr:SprT-like domain-containing protein [Bacilli bacterium]
MLKLTEQFLIENHEKYNKMYFNGVLSMPKFLIKKTSKRTLGYYSSLKNVIMVSTYYVREEKDFLNTLIHEMIHQFIHEQKIKDSSVHGYSFKSIAHRINVDGWNITARTKLPQNTKTSETKIYHVIKINEIGLKTRSFLMVTSANNYDYFYWELRKRYHDKVERYKTTNPIFSSFKQCRSRVLGKYVFDDEIAKYDK